MEDSVLISNRHAGRYQLNLARSDMPREGAFPPMNSVARKYVARLPENVHVLIVDDDPYFRSLLKVMLQQAGLPDGEFLEAEDSGEAVRICQREPVELVFCDLNLPVLRSKNGLEIIRELRMLSADVPMYMVTADASEALIERVRAVGATGHILKPINLRILKRILVAGFLQNLEPIIWQPASP
jgi:CheY-like chemotaxis protein